MLNDGVIAERIGLDKKCGYWEIDKKYFFDKFDCLRYATSIKKYDVKYHFYDSVYQSLNWSKEPTEDLQTMYKNRAQQLRDEYDYLILSFSGGADSSNILRTFIDNNIKIDEIYCEYPLQIIEKYKHTFNYSSNAELIIFEWITAAEPQLKELSKAHPSIKITTESIVQESIDVIDNCELHKHRRGGSVNPLIRFHKLYEMAKRRTIHGRVACINGLDKPRIAFNSQTKKFICAYSDFSNAFSEFSTYAFSENQISIEQFYHTYRYPELNQKMCFQLKNALLQIMNVENKKLYLSLLDHIKPNGIHVFDVHKNYLKKVLYEKWNTNIWQAQKSSNIFYSPLTHWFFDPSITTDRTRDFFDKQLLELLQGIDNRFIAYTNGKPSSLIHMTTTGIDF
jgi:hypothetical protein